MNAKRRPISLTVASSSSSSSHCFNTVVQHNLNTFLLNNTLCIKKVCNFVKSLPTFNVLALLESVWLVSWSLTSLFSTNMAISETKGQGWRVIFTQWRKCSHILTSTLAAFLFSSHPKKGKGSKSVWHYPPHLRHVAILPWEIKHSNFLHTWKKTQTNCLLKTANFAIPPQISIFYVFTTRQYWWWYWNV